MDVPALLAKAAGVVFLAMTVRSIVKHVRERIAAAHSGADAQAKSEKALNNTLLYAWLAFSLAFSMGLILNN
jgi:hypothetical protein